MKKIWKIKKIDEEIISHLCKDMGIDRITAMLLNIRGINSKEEGNNFFNPDFTAVFHNPFLIKDMEKAVERVRKAIEEKEYICIFGDRDVDGVSSSALLYESLKKLNAHVDVSVPRGDEGYGLSEKVVDSFNKSGCKLIITVDNGITSFKAVEKANKNNMDVIITDHHTPEEKLPAAIAVINPKCEDNYPFKDLAGVGVVYKFIYSLFYSYTPYYNKEIVAVDLETTGLDLDDDQIIEIGAVKMRNFVQTGKFQEFIKPSGPLSGEVKKITGITDKELSTAGPASSVIKEFNRFINGAVLVGHNIDEFDLKFIKRYIRKYLDKDIENETIDTLKLARAHLNLTNNKLSDVALFFKIKSTRRSHRAYADALIVVEIFKMFFKITKKIKKILEEFIEYAVLGTLADVVPLNDENRMIVKYGLERIRNTSIIGIDILLKKMNIDKETLTSRTLVWNVIPVLNSPGRMGMADKSLKLLLTQDEDEAGKIADEIISINEDRKSRQGIIFNKIMDTLEDKVDIKHDKIFIIDIQDVAHGVTGIIANKIKDLYYRPIVVLVVNDDLGIGSGRSIEQFMIHEAFKKCEDLFIDFGGHKYAVGFSIKSEKIEEFKDRLKKIADQSLEDEDLLPVLGIDAEISGELLSTSLIKKIEQRFAPYGQENNEPLFLIKNLELSNLIPIGKDKKHLKLIMETEGTRSFDALLWSGTEKDYQFMIGKNYDLVFKPQINLWKNKESVSLIVEDMRLSE